MSELRRPSIDAGPTDGHSEAAPDQLEAPDTAMASNDVRWLNGRCQSIVSCGPTDATGPSLLTLGRSRPLCVFAADAA